MNMKRTNLRRPFHIAALACLWALIGIWQATDTQAQNTVFTYQGRVTDNGTNFTGAGQFEFALVYQTNLSRQATGEFTDILGGTILGIQLDDGGNGYFTPPLVTISGGGGSGATATATVSGGMVTALNLTAGGSGYFSETFLTIAPPSPILTNATLWNNDGTTGGMPAAAVPVGVTNGLFTVVLGDTNLPNMTAIPAGFFAQPNLLLQIWFNDGVNGFAALSPAQLLTPTPYAVSASNLSGTLPTSQLTGTFSGNGSGLSSLQSSSLSGAIPTGLLTSVPAGNLTGTIPATTLGVTNSFTATIGDGTHNFTMSTQSGYYAEVGNLVYVEIFLKWTGKGSATAASSVEIGLPFTVVSARAPFTIGFFQGLTFTSEVTAGANQGAANLLLYSPSNTGGGATNLTVSSCAIMGELQLSGWYRRE